LPPLKDACGAELHYYLLRTGRKPIKAIQVVKVPASCVVS
jgi:hypothetical protein